MNNVFMSINIFENIHRQTTVLAINSLLTSFSSSIILAINIVPNMGTVFNVDEKNFIAFRVLAESIGYFSKVATGYISDISNNRRFFILSGYKVVIILKTILLIFSYGFGSPTTRCQVFNTCNITDKLFNVMRDSVRDAHLCDCVPAKYRASNMSFRKNFSLVGNVIGLSFFTIMYKHFNLSVSTLLAISLSAAAGGWMILFFYLKEYDREKYNKHYNNINKNNSEYNSDKETSIIQQVHNVVLERKTLLILLLSCCILFMGKVDDMLFTSCYPDGNPRLLLNIIYACTPVLFSKYLLSYIIKEPILALFICGILFSAYNTFFYILIINKYKILFAGIVAVMIQGIYRTIIDPIFIGLITRSKKVTPRIHGTIIGIINLVIATGVWIRYSMGRHIGCTTKILLSTPITIIGLSLLMLFAYFDNKKEKKPNSPAYQ